MSRLREDYKKSYSQHIGYIINLDLRPVEDLTALAVAAVAGNGTQMRVALLAFRFAARSARKKHTTRIPQNRVPLSVSPPFVVSPHLHLFSRQILRESLSRAVERAQGAPLSSAHRQPTPPRT